ncbi:hypothetical protein BS636_14445 [Acinetobacter sp. LoGeW2-3]|uniref:BapA/Bap/LapF family prefix-like domain-containing protein n=1 Tax=Acinetobacter sp. LoGeW2-3 TaxID=1808001 RepID=UPI000C05B8B0|nr:BapA prefix-like domain-containing protein [Acinetobacter sp. LoGeW2-3]ATO20794.1 hypothetical protein BS636_14445 [Acinetobacter sp. LoGeW2-3]
MQVQVISKENGSNNLIKNYSQKIELNNNSVVLIDVKVEDIEKIEYLNNQAVITLKNGEKIAVDNFNIEESSLVFRNEQAELFLFDFKTITYNPIDKIEPLLYGQSESSFVSVWPWAAGAAVIGGLAIAAGSSGSSSGSNSHYENNNLSELEKAKTDLADTITKALTDAEDFDGQAEIDALKAVNAAKDALVTATNVVALEEAQAALEAAIAGLTTSETAEDGAEDALADAITAAEAVEGLNPAIQTELAQAIAAAEEVKNNSFSNQAQLEKAALALDAAVVKAKADQDVLENSDELTQAKADLAGAITDALTDAEDFDGQAEIDALKAVNAAKDALVTATNVVALEEAQAALEAAIAGLTTSEAEEDVAEDALAGAIVDAKAVKDLDQAIKAELDQAIAAAEEVKSNPFSNEDQLEKAALALDAAVVKAKADQDVLENSDELTQAKADLAGAITDALTDAEDFDGQAEIDALKAVNAAKDALVTATNVVALEEAQAALEAAIAGLTTSEAEEDVAEMHWQVRLLMLKQ